MENKLWKEFGKNKLTHSGAHYLMAIHELKSEQGYARLSDVAKRLKISKGSLSTSLKPLIKKKLILEDENKHFDLSDEGLAYAENIENAYRVVNHLLAHILGVDEKTASIDACKIEHLLSFESTTNLLKFVRAMEDNEDVQKKIVDMMNKYDDCNLKACRKCKKRKSCFLGQS